MVRKAASYLVEVDGVPLRAAMLLKQEMLAVGGDSAHHRDVAGLKIPASRALLLGTWGQYLHLAPKLRRQPFKLPELAGELETALRNYSQRKPRPLRLAHGRQLTVGGRSLVMGVVNVTPDSFSDGGRFLDPSTAIAQGRRLLEEGADLLDVGGESTRPGARPVPVQVEMRRVLPVIEGLRRATDRPISVDTRKSGVARAALRAGADLVNDVEGLRGASMRRVVARSDAGAVVMHMRGDPRTMQASTDYQDLRSEVFRFLAERTEEAEAAGVRRDGLVIDPGIGFGKSYEGNLDLLGHVGEFRALGYPVLIGASRKGFVGAALGGAPLAERLEGSIACAVAAALRGTEILRVHDVAPTVRALRVADAIRTGRLR
jgi:dihydropteroate synthase